ncbi:hypothetical protein COCON_G00158910 [Conger conger]|uniref:Serine/threonine-protein phosphatase PGAM5, mitochondrial n=1 Tax=Conger conger TaxID=82655 RepID=A0A9Q1DAJ3_CONCO|nr:serine/threonine-protein phosphatase PGAM5, mitochondrial isoform X1 [Conger conger]KAJ8263434.1 hypothetical protein COCON_G00158910 [Conger conger]
MSYRRVVKLVCGIAGGAAVLVSAATAAESLGYLGDKSLSERLKIWTGFAVLQAAQPPTWALGNHTVASSGNGWDTNWDKRDPSSFVNVKKKDTATDDPNSETESNKPKATRNIFLIRHSQYNLNGNGDKEKTLTLLGREQAELTGQRLADLGLKYNVLVHSTMTRATETANIISKHLPGVELVSCDLLREGAPIEPVPAVSHWKPEAAQYHEDGARIEAAFRHYVHRADAKQKEDSYEIIVCHANVIRYFVCRALQFPPEGWLRMGLNNGSITWITVRPSGRVGLRTLGDSGFMPPDKLTRT